MCTVPLSSRRGRQTPYGLFKESGQPLLWYYTKQPDEMPGLSASPWPRVSFSPIFAFHHAVATFPIWTLKVESERWPDVMTGTSLLSALLFKTACWARGLLGYLSARRPLD